jgi:hypothetical protein
VPLADQEVAQTKPLALVGTDMIVSKNLFDPERGEGRNREAETNSRAFQRVRGMILLGTAILGNNRYAILSDSAASAVPGQTVPPQSANIMRLKLGDNVEGFSLTEVRDKIVVFSKGASKVELTLDYFRKVEPAAAVRAPIPQSGVGSPVPGQAGPTTPPVPRVLPQAPRRPRPTQPLRPEE